MMAENGDAHGGSAASTEREGAEGKGRKLDAKSQSSIEDRLRAMFDNVAQEPVPDRFVDLLNQLESTHGSGENTT